MIVSACLLARLAPFGHVRVKRQKKENAIPQKSLILFFFVPYAYVVVLNLTQIKWPERRATLRKVILQRKSQNDDGLFNLLFQKVNYNAPTMVPNKRTTKQCIAKSICFPYSPPFGESWRQRS